MRELSNSTDSAAQAQASAMLGKIYRENNCHPVKVIAEKIVVKILIILVINLLIWVE
mgnify:FL=1